MKQEAGSNRTGRQLLLDRPHPGGPATCEDLRGPVRRTCSLTGATQLTYLSLAERLQGMRRKRE